MKLKYILIYILSVISSAVVIGQPTQIIFEKISSEQGLSENVINCIYQDRQGFMWFGTNDGLNRYDGYDFKVFRPEANNHASISSNLIYALTQDQQGTIWIGTTGDGLNRYNPNTEEFTVYPNNEEEHPLRDAQILTLFTDSKGRVWTGTLDGVFVIEPQADEHQEAPYRKINISKPENVLQTASAQTIVEDKSGNIWIGNRYGLYRCLLRDQGNDFNFQKILVNDAIPNDPIRSICLDDHGMLVLGASSGLYQQDKRTSELSFARIADTKNQLTVISDDNGKIWSGTYNGIECYDNSNRDVSLEFEQRFKHNDAKRHSLSNNVIRVLYKDKTGIVWAGTNGGGLNKYNPNRKPFYSFGDDLIKDGDKYTDIRSIYQDSNGDSWIGTEGGGLFYSQNEDEFGNYTNYKSIATSKNVFCLREILHAERKYLFIGSEDSPNLQYIDITGDTPKEPVVVPDIPGSVFSILQDNNGSVWIGSYNRGLSRLQFESIDKYKISTFQKEDYDNAISDNIIRTLHEDGQGNLWVGTSNGLNMVDKDNLLDDAPMFNKFVNDLNNPKTISHNYILDIDESVTGELWIGTFGGGINKLVEENSSTGYSFKRYEERNGLANNTIKSIESDIAGNVWMASNKGLSKLNPDSEEIHNFSASDGLQHMQFSESASFKQKNGELLFGGVQGFNSFYPEAIQTDNSKSSLAFTKILINNEPISTGKSGKNGTLVRAESSKDKIELNHNQNDISIEFSALHYASPNDNKYRYKLEGDSEEWISNKRHATFTNLSHGSYTLQVQSSNGDNVWSQETAELDIVIKPPFWLSWVAYLIYALLFIGGIILVRRYTVISIRDKHDLILEHMEREKLEELNQMKIRFFTNISHELRTPLTLIISPLENILEKGKNMPAEKVQQQYHYMYKNAKYLLRLVNQLLDFRKLDEGSFNLRVGRGDIVDFVNETTEPFQFLASKKNIDFNIVNHRDNIDTFFDPDVIEKVIYNLLSNAFKFTPTGGKISIALKEIYEKKGKVKLNKKGEQHFLQLIVSDNGPGFSKKKAKKIFKRFYKESSKVANKDGAGIGLSFVKSLVDLHRGEISVKSEKDAGSIFTVSIPMEKGAYLKSEINQFQFDKYETSSDPLEYLVAEPVLAIADSPTVESVSSPENELPLMLFVDDNADIRRFITDGFENDFRIIVAENGEAGLEVAKRSLPEIIVSDVMMPKMNGIEMCQQLKSDQATSHIPVVLLTAKSTNEDKLEGLETGADAYVVKPFKLDILRAQILNIHLQREKLKQRFRQEVILEPEDITVTSADEEFLKRAMAIIEDHMSDSEFNVEALVKEMYISRSKLYLKLKALTGQSSSEFIRTVRLKRAIQLLEKSDYTIKEVMFMTGFNTGSYFSKCFKKQFGIVPSDYIKQRKAGERETTMSKDKIEKIISPSEEMSLTS